VLHAIQCMLAPQQSHAERAAARGRAETPSTSSMPGAAAPPGVLGLPPCVSEHILRRLDADGVRVLRGVCRSLYFEASARVTCLTVTHANLDTLVGMPLHEVMPAISRLSFSRGLKREALRALFTNVLPYLRRLDAVDLCDGPLHEDATVWGAFVAGLPKCRAVAVTLREPTSWWARSAVLSGLPGDGRDTSDHFPQLLEALKVPDCLHAHTCKLACFNACMRAAHTHACMEGCVQFMHRCMQTSMQMRGWTACMHACLYAGRRTLPALCRRWCVRWQRSYKHAQCSVLVCACVGG